MRTYSLELVVDGREVGVFVAGPLARAFVYVNGTTLGRVPLDLASRAELDEGTADRAALAGLDPRRFAAQLGAALRVETDARAVLAEATRYAAAGRDRARAAMRAAADECSSQARHATGGERDRLERVRARIEALSARFA